ncbi:hypothetical protein F4678DRAFT_460429 [Xylaria arbuscula]|nr:hypothetical protein F4678DRAFT_460429 [Xylaria arbuscula]
MASQDNVASAAGVDLKDLDQKVQSFLSGFLSRLQPDNEQELSLFELKKRMLFLGSEFNKAREVAEAINIELAAEKNKVLVTKAYYTGKAEEVERLVQQFKGPSIHMEANSRQSLVAASPTMIDSLTDNITKINETLQSIQVTELAPIRNQLAAMQSWSPEALHERLDAATEALEGINESTKSLHKDIRGLLSKVNEISPSQATGATNGVIHDAMGPHREEFGQSGRTSDNITSQEDITEVVTAAATSTSQDGLPGASTTGETTALQEGATETETAATTSTSQEDLLSGTADGGTQTAQTDASGYETSDSFDSADLVLPPEAYSQKGLLKRVNIASKQSHSR